MQIVTAAAATQAIYSFVNVHKLGLNPKKAVRGQGAVGRRDL